MKKLAKQFNYKVIEVNKDGNCQFNAVSKSLENVLGVKYSHKELRKMVVKYLENDREFLKLYLAYVLDEENITDKKTDKYLKKMGKIGTWGDMITLLVMSKILKVKFNLLIVSLESFQTVSIDDNFPIVVPLGYIDNEHYTSLVPKIITEVQEELVEAQEELVKAQEVEEQAQEAVVEAQEVEEQAQEAVVEAQEAVVEAPKKFKPSMSLTKKLLPSVITPSVSQSIKPSIVPSASPIDELIGEPSSSVKINQTVDLLAPTIPKVVFDKVKPLSSMNELLEIMDKVKPYIYDDISQLQKAEKQIMVSLGM